MGKGSKDHVEDIATCPFTFKSQSYNLHVRSVFVFLSISTTFLFTSNLDCR